MAHSKRPKRTSSTGPTNSAPDRERANAAIAHASHWIAHRLLAMLTQKNLLTHEEAIQILQEGVDGYASGGPTEKAAALLLEQLKTYHQKAAGLVVGH